MTADSNVIKLAIIGCGAVAQERYLPAASLVPNLAFTHVVDLDMQRARDTADRFQIPDSAGDYRQVLGQVDAVIVATPPKSHAQISIDCLSAGVHVLCEKPLATSVGEAQQMIAVSQRTHTHLAVGMIRRLNWDSQLLKRLVQQGWLGEIYRFDAEEGGEFRWPLRTGHIFTDGSSGGVLADAGSHIFDLVLWCLGSRRAQLVRCRDDNWGGVEANAVVELMAECHSRPIAGRVELSFTRDLRNTLRIYGENGYLEASTRGGLEVFCHRNGEDVDPIIMRLSNARPLSRIQGFALQLSNFIDSVIYGSRRYVAAEDTLATISLVEQCHRSRESMAQPWEIKHLESFFRRERDG